MMNGDEIDEFNSIELGDLGAELMPEPAPTSPGAPEKSTASPRIETKIGRAHV
jgi:hypothetical protein